MADAHKNKLNTDLIGRDLANCCRGEDICGECQQTHCVIGYAKRCIENFEKAPKKNVPSGVRNIPTMDIKVFDEVELETAIAHILKECKECKEDHTDNCIINVIRSCYEVGLFGDVQPYEGITLEYLVQLKNNFPEKAGQIAAIYASLS